MIEITKYIAAVPVGMHPAVCTAVEVTTSKIDQSQYRLWTFTFPTFGNATVTTTSSLQTTPKSKGGRWIAALLGRVPDEGENVKVIGRPCQCYVTHNEDGFERIDDVQPAAAGQAAPSARQPVAEQVYAAEAPQPSTSEAAAPASVVSDELPF